MKEFCKTVLIVCFLSFFLLSCSQEPPKPKPEPEAEVKVQLLWSMEDIKHAEDLANEMGGVFLTHDRTVNMKPPFYQGEMPLKFVAVGKQMGGGSMGGSMGAACIYDFGTWRIYFIYREMRAMIQGMPDGAVAIDSETKQIIGECKVLEMLSEDGMLSGFKLAENHFNMQGEMIFTGVFEIDFPLGFKTKELQTRGQKEREYFFLWPNGIGGMF